MPLDAFTQDERLIAVQTSLGKDHFLLTGFSGHEAVSQLFEFDLELVSENLAVDQKYLVGANVTFSIRPQEGTRSFFNGFISHFCAAEPAGRFGRSYRAHIVPWLWFLTRASNSRIFQNMNVVDIAKKVFSDHGFNDFEFRLLRSYSPYEYKVQYRETDFNFVSRLLEHEGIFYFDTPQYLPTHRPPSGRASGKTFRLFPRRPGSKSMAGIMPMSSGQDSGRCRIMISRNRGPI
jgi:type VI secretion system secreted protein VgrG